MSKARLNNLPSELLQQVASYLKHPCVLSLSLVSRPCRAAAIPWLFRNMIFRIDSRNALKQDIASLDEALSRADAFKHVRSLEINGEFLGYYEGKNKVPGEDGYLPWRVAHQVDGHHDESVYLNYFADYEPPSSTRADDVFWQPLAHVLDKLTGLGDFIFDCSYQFPPCLLKVLHSHLPACKLHIRSLRLRSLRDEEIDPHEYELATSPNLLTVFAGFEVFNEDGDDVFGDLAIMEMVSGFALNLREVRLRNFPSIDTIRRPNPMQHRGEFRGLPRKTPAKKGALEVLDLDSNELGNGPTTRACFERWDEVTDFSKLRCLYLDHVDDQALQFGCIFKPFRALTTLKLCVNTQSQFGPLDVTVSAFLETLPPLQDFQVRGDFDEDNLDALINQQNGSDSLRRLHVVPRGDRKVMTFSSQLAMRLGVQCPSIEGLRLTIDRPLGSKEEVGLYKAFGLFHRLRKLFLTLDCRNLALMTEIPPEHANDEEYAELEASNEPWFESFEHQVFPPATDPDLCIEHRPQNGHIMFSILNGAIDKYLAMPIYNTISGKKRQGNKPLHSLKLHPVNSCRFSCSIGGDGARSLKDVTRHTELSWHIERTIRDDGSPPTVSYLYPYAVNSFGSALMEPLDESVEDVLERIWPNILEEGRDWRTDWYSQPLFNSLPTTGRIPELA